MILQGRGICKGAGHGELILVEKPISFLGGVDPSDGVLADCGERRTSISGKVFAFPRGRGSTVGSYTLLEMKRQGTLPAALINQTAEPIVATGAVMAGVPLVDHIDLSLLRQGDECTVDGDKGTVEVTNVRDINVVTCLLMHRDKILILRRSDLVGSFQGYWAGVSGYVEEGETPAGCAMKEVEEETGISSLRLMSSAPPIRVRSDANLWTIHPFLFSVEHDHVSLDWEHTEYKWIEADQILNYETVPEMGKILAVLGLKKKEERV